MRIPALLPLAPANLPSLPPRSESIVAGVKHFSLKGRKNTLMRVINYLLYVNGCFLLGTGLLLTYRLPPGSQGGKGLGLWGLDRHEWGDLHFYAGLGIVALTLAHLFLNWAWIRKIAGSSKALPLLLGFSVGLVVILIFLLAPIEAIRPGGR